ncbi:peptidase S8/S53 domain-containing protein [Cladochytrium replicatum]|nr:peptidase S8/S53 domain-containing protein [Cladochytrium replicatum]
MLIRFALLVAAVSYVAARPLASPSKLQRRQGPGGNLLFFSKMEQLYLQPLMKTSRLWDYRNTKLDWVRKQVAVIEPESTWSNAPGPESIASRRLIPDLESRDEVSAVFEDVVAEFVATSVQDIASSIDKFGLHGLKRIASKTFNAAKVAKQYTFPSSAGEGVPVFVVDDGMRVDHVEFEGRASYGDDFTGTNPKFANSGEHGTHVAGTVGSKTFGVAKKVKLVNVRVLPGTGGSVIAGLDFVLKQVAQKNLAMKAVINMSLSTPSFPPLDEAIRRVTDAGIAVAVAAGNQNQDACLRTPARAPEALTVAAAGENDGEAGFSNFGSCTDIFGSGTQITSLAHDSTTGTAVKAGTSMASPHVAVRFQTTQTDVHEFVLSRAIPNVLKNVKEKTENLMVFNGVESVEETTTSTTTTTRTTTTTTKKTKTTTATTTTTTTKKTKTTTTTTTTTTNRATKTTTTTTTSAAPTFSDVPAIPEGFTANFQGKQVDFDSNKICENLDEETDGDSLTIIGPGSFFCINVFGGRDSEGTPRQFCASCGEEKLDENGKCTAQPSGRLRHHSINATVSTFLDFQDR